ncbi:MAG: formate dehydrogenase accessory sulfurtransferase FdhD, partial [Candidatus Eremiobacteraeota bacterium]|nr:formate dehydrogenase accessory sulfurtransferase FdhD [Candidatus Eremiobacteraeota bacterium]
MTTDEARTRPGRTTETTVVALDGTHRAAKDDRIVTEEPLEIRLKARAAAQKLAVTMRTPGNDLELAAGFVFDEGIVHAREEI